MNIDKTYFQFHVNAVFLRGERRFFIPDRFNIYKLAGLTVCFDSF